MGLPPQVSEASSLGLEFEIAEQHALTNGRPATVTDRREPSISHTRTVKGISESTLTDVVGTNSFETEPTRGHETMALV